MRIIFRTNLDEPQRDVAALNDKCLETEHHPVPRIGDDIEFGFRGPNGERFSFDLRVVQVTYVHDVDFASGNLAKPHISVELHVPLRGQSISEWSANYKRHRYGRTA